MSRRRSARTRRRQPKGMALLLVLTTIAVLALVLVEFSSSAHTHLSTGVNIRDEVRATQLAETALVMTRACLDDTAWGPMASMQNRIDPEILCNMMLGIFIQSRVDLPIGGLSVELNQIKGLGLEKGEVEDIMLKAEDGFIGLAGLWCPPGQLKCSSRSRVMTQLRVILCDPKLAHLFEREQEDGHRYTREEVVGNIIDWIDADDQRVYIDPLNWGALSQGAGEGEDAYLRELEDRYRSKDAPFESIEELRMIRGINDELFDALKDQVSVYAASSQVNVNSASPQVIAALLASNRKGFFVMDFPGCGEDIETVGFGVANIQQAVEAYARLIAQATTLKRGINITKAFRNPQDFVRLARDPLTSIMNQMGNNPMAGGGGFGLGPEVILQQYGLTPQLYAALIGPDFIDWNQVQRSITTQNRIYRLRVRARVGNMTRRIFAILLAEGKTVRTLYYREE